MHLYRLLTRKKKSKKPLSFLKKLYFFKRFYDMMNSFFAFKFESVINLSDKISFFEYTISQL